VSKPIASFVTHGTADIPVSDRSMDFGYSLGVLSFCFDAPLAMRLKEETYSAVPKTG
jgi:hypothetical protein